VAMKQAIAPLGQARNDYDTFADLAARFGAHEAFTEGRGEMEFLRHLYETTAAQAARWEMRWPSFDTFWAQGFYELPAVTEPYVAFADFRADPVGNPLATPSGRIELFSETIASFGYTDCPGHPTWIEPHEWLGSDKTAKYPLHLLTTQPHSRLHAQMDMGRVSQENKIGGREPIRIHPADAAKRGLRDGDIVRVFNDRGALLAGVVVSDELRPGVVQMATGAWYDPEEPGVIGSLDKHGNPNVLTSDKGTSCLAQGCSAQSTLVEMEKYTAPSLPVTAFVLPAIDSA